MLFREVLNEKRSLRREIRRDLRGGGFVILAARRRRSLGFLPGEHDLKSWQRAKQKYGKRRDANSRKCCAEYEIGVIEAGRKLQGDNGDIADKHGRGGEQSDFKRHF